MADELSKVLKMEVISNSACLKDIVFSVEENDIKKECSKILSEIASYASIPGFRQGKAPVGMIKKRYSSHLAEELNRRVLSEAIRTVYEDESLDMVGYSFKENPTIEVDAPCKFTVTIELAPEVKIGDYKTFKTDVEMDAVTEEQIDENITKYRSLYGNYEDVDSKAVEGDMLKVSYTSDFEVAEDSSNDLKRQVAAEDSFIWLSEPETIPNCIKSLDGAEVNKSYTIEATYPSDYRISELADKTVKYEVTVKGIQRRKDLSDEELMQKMNADSMEALRTNLRNYFESEAKYAKKAKVREALVNMLTAEAGEFELPTNALESETNKEIQNIARELVKSEEDVEKFKAEIETHRATAKENAIKSLRYKFIMRNIAKIEKITVDAKEVDMQLMMAGYQTQKTAQQLRNELEKNGQLPEVEFDILVEKTINTLVDRVME